jgi:hypothetical protein
MREIIFKNTNDDWCGNYENNQVKLMYIGKLSDGTFRVAVWGNDDLGIEKDFKDESDAKSVFNILKERPIINKQDLFDLQFIYA